jgi:hypothetical protein
MDALETLFHLEVEFHWRLRASDLGVYEVKSIHTSYALENGYERLIVQAGNVKAEAIETLATRNKLSEDPRDVQWARDSLLMLIPIAITRTRERSR